MKLNWIEKLLVNNPVRAHAQRRYESRAFERLGGRCEGGRALEIGCGRGVGVEIILDAFGAAEVDAFDLDPDMVERARKRLARRPAGRVRLWTGDATAIPCPDAAYDAVFDFGTIHHVPDWKKAVREVARVLRPGGRFYFHEITREALETWVYRTFTDHPSENRFDARDFLEEIGRCGIVPGPWRTRFFGHFLLGVGRRAAAASGSPLAPPGG